MAAAALVPVPAVLGTSQLVVNDHVDEVVRIVRMHCTRDPEFILRELRNVQTVAVHRVETEGAVRRILRTIPGIYQMTIRLGARRGTPATRVYSSITAGKFPSEVNYAGRVFQLDIVFLPWLRNVKGAIVRGRALIPVLTCVCVASRYALVKRLDRTTHDHVYNMMKAHVLPVIYDKLDEIMRLDAQRVLSGYYTEAAFRARCAAAARARVEALTAREARQREARTARARRTVEYYEERSAMERGPFGANDWPAGAPFVRDLARHGRPIRRKFENYNPHEDERVRAKENWLVDLQDMQLRSDAGVGDISPTTGIVDQRALDARAAASVEVTEPWHRVHPHVTLVTDDGEFGTARREAHEYASRRGYPAPHWCTVNKSELPRKGVQIVERFHRTLRAMWAISFTMQTATDPSIPDVNYVLEKLIPATYNATRSSSTMCTPSEMWDFLVDGTAQRAHVGMRSAFPLGTLVTVLGKTDETHPVVFRTADKVFEVVGHNAYTREIAEHDTASRTSKDADLQLGPIAPHLLREITRRGAQSLALMSLQKVSVPRLALGASDNRQVRRELVDVSKDNHAPGIGPKSSLALVQGTGPTSAYPLIEADRSEAERSEEDESVSHRVSRGDMRFLIENGAKVVRNPDVPELDELTVTEAVGKRYTDPKTGKRAVYGPGDLVLDVRQQNVTLEEPVNAITNGAVGTIGTGNSKSNRGSVRAIAERTKRTERTERAERRNRNAS